MVRMIVAGSRGFDDYGYLSEKLDGIIEEIHDEIEIVSGGAKGADSLGEQYAEERGIPVKQFAPDWKRFGKSAGFRRNREMLDYAKEEQTVVVAFWDGESKGTADTIKKARMDGVDTRIFFYFGMGDD